jgi:hypothetical protein
LSSIGVIHDFLYLKQLFYSDSVGSCLGIVILNGFISKGKFLESFNIVAEKILEYKYE